MQPRNWLRASAAWPGTPLKYKLVFYLTLQVESEALRYHWPKKHDQDLRVAIQVSHYIEGTEQ